MVDVDTPPEDARSIVARLRVLAQQFPDDEHVQINLAIGLRNLGVDAALDEERRLVDELKELVDRCMDNPLTMPTVAQQLAASLANLTAAPDIGITDARSAVADLRQLRERFPHDQYVALQLAKALFNLTADPEVGLEETSTAVDELRTLAARFPDDAGIAFRLAKGLYNLFASSDPGKAVEELRGLRDRFAGDEDIISELADALVNLSDIADLPTAVVIAQELSDLARQFPDVATVGIDLAFALFSVCRKPEASGDQINAAERSLRDLVEERRDGDIKTWLAPMLIVVLSRCQSREQATPIVDELVQMMDAHVTAEDSAASLVDLFGESSNILAGASYWSEQVLESPHELTRILAVAAAGVDQDAGNPWT